MCSPSPFPVLRPDHTGASSTVSIPNQHCPKELPRHRSGFTNSCLHWLLPRNCKVVAAALSPLHFLWVPPPLNSEPRLGASRRSSPECHLPGGPPVTGPQHGVSLTLTLPDLFLHKLFASKFIRRFVYFLPFVVNFLPLRQNNISHEGKNFFVFLPYSFHSVQTGSGRK